MDDLKQGSNVVFKLEGSPKFVHEAPEIRRAWERYRENSGNKTTGQCLVTGEVAPIARLHPALKGLKGANTSGATLVGFNASAYESYNRTKGQGLNSPTSEVAAFKYATTLNYLLSRESESPKFTMGDTTVVYWAESKNKGFTDLFCTLWDPEWTDVETVASKRDPATARLLKDVASKIRSGAPVDVDGILAELDANPRFYVLGLAPNAARVSVRFFYRDLFKKVIERIMAHYKDLEIIREFDNEPLYLSVRSLIDETVSQKSRDKEPSPLMTGSLMRAILNNTPYPAALYNGVINRIRADQDDQKYRIRKINYARAAIIKAYLTRKYRNSNQSQIQEVLRMALNEQSTNPAYLLGRLFAVLEKAQQDAAAPAKLNATIKDRYFTSACASPASVFPVLLRLAQHHISKAEYGYINDRRIQEILNLLDIDQNPIPSHLSLDEQGVFVLGYYHQRVALYIPKENNQPV